MTNPITLATSAASIAPLRSMDSGLSNADALKEARKDLFSSAAELGRTAGKGARGLVLLAAETVRASQEGIITCSSNLKGKQKGVTTTDDAALLFQRYRDSFSNQNSFKSLAQQESKLRAFIKLGALPETKVDGVAVFNRAAAIWKKGKEADYALLDEHKAMLNVTYRQLEKYELTGKRMTDEEIGAAMTKEKEDDSEIDLLKAMLKKAEKAYAIKPRDETADIMEKLASLLTYCEREEDVAAKMQQLDALKAELGIAA